MHHKPKQAMAVREGHYALDGIITIDDIHLGGERSGGTVGRGRNNNASFIAAISLTKDDRPPGERMTPVPGFALKAVSVSAKDHLTPSSAVFADALCFGALTDAGCTHHPPVMDGRKPKDVTEFR